MSSDARARILLVDDRPENLTALGAILEPLGQTLVAATSGEQALKHLLHEEFMLILLDVRMPGLDGIETARLIKEREKTRDIPIIFLTAVSKDAEEVMAGYEAGAVDYVFKPFEPAVLRSKVAVFVDLHEKNQRLERQAELLRERELAELRQASEERFRRLSNSMPQIVWSAAPDGLVTYFSEQWYDYTGRSPEESLGVAWLGALHPDDVPRTVSLWERAYSTGERYEVEYRCRRGDGAFRWQLARGLPIRVEGDIAEWVGTCTDIEDHKRLEAEQSFLVEASAELASSLDYTRTLVKVAELAVPRIADWCGVEMLEPDGSLRQLAVVHADPKKVELARELDRRYPPDPMSEHGSYGVVRSGQPELVPEITDEMIVAVARDDLHRDLLREIGLTSYISMPMVARDRVLGVISVVLAAESGRRYGQRDLVLVEELARRAATAVDNARLYAEVEERAQASRVLAAIADGVVLLDREERTRLFNPAAEAITGLAAADVLGKTPAEFIRDWEEIRKLIPVASDPAAAAAAGGSHAETVPIEVNERELWLSVAGVSFDEGTVYAFRDLTEEHNLEQLRADFVATVSHELRTPLAAIYGAAVTVRRTDIELQEATRNRLLQVISQESERLARIVEDVLLASHLDSGRLQHRIEAVDVAALVRTVLLAAEIHLPANVTLALEASEELPPVAADEGQLRQVFVNLVDNAVKYSPDGGRVTVTLEAEPAYVRVAIADEGLGIPRGERQRIFEKFYRLDPNMTRGIGGTGLGLYICRELVRRIDGRIWVDSRQGGGSIFYVELPVAKKTRRQPARRAKQAVGSS